MNDITEGLYDVEEIYTEKLLWLIKSKHFQLNESDITAWKDDSLKLYICVLLSAGLDFNFPV